MNELATEEMESSKERIRQEASGCPLQSMHTQRTVLDADDDLVFPNRVVPQYSTDASGAAELHLCYGEIEISFGEPGLFASGKGLAKQSGFVARTAATWANGYDSPPVRERLEQLISADSTEARATPSAQQRHKRRASRNRSLALLLGSVAAAGMQLPEHALAQTNVIETPAHARLQGLESLRLAVRQDGGVPMPERLNEFVKDRKAAVRLGKALFWDMQVGSDGVQACASCHYHAGADNRSKNALNPDEGFFDTRDGDVQGYHFAEPVPESHFETKQPNGTLTREDFPFLKTIQDLIRTSDGRVEPGLNNSNDIAGSMGIHFHLFDGVRPGIPFDSGTPQPDPVFNVDGRGNVRQVEHLNTPTVINAVFNFTNLWNGAANNHFNGRNVFGDQDDIPNVFVNRPGVGLVMERISLENASLASQAMNPPRSGIEMSFGDPGQGNVRNHYEIGLKLLRPSRQTGIPLIPLGLQHVHPQDSVLGTFSNAPFRGLATSYEGMIKEAFAEQYWNSTKLTELPGTPGPRKFNQMEANFGLFFGLAVLMYQSTLVADSTPFDHWMETGRFNSGFDETALAGLNVFVNQGQCIRCHAGPELTTASVRNAQGGKNLIGAKAMAQGFALFDVGFSNIGVTPTTDDLGRGDLGIALEVPQSFARQALFDRLGIADIGFPILGNDHIPARDKDLGTAVCDDANANGLCDPSETIRPDFRRVAVDGAFKTPGLRNAELTGPYFHNGGMATLRQAVQFYNRGGNFCSFNLKDLDPTIRPLGLTEDQEGRLVAFLVSLTDGRVKYQQAPFDHPELRIPRDGRDTRGTRRIRAVGARGSKQPLGTFLDLDPQDAIFTPSGLCSRDDPR